MRFGLEDGSEHTLEEVGQTFALTRERIRQIEAKALRKLRNRARASSASSSNSPREISSRPPLRSNLERRNSNLKESELGVNWARLSMPEMDFWCRHRPAHLSRSLYILLRKRRLALATSVTSALTRGVPIDASRTGV